MYIQVQLTQGHTGPKVLAGWGVQGIKRVVCAVAVAGVLSLCCVCAVTVIFFFAASCCFFFFFKCYAVMLLCSVVLCVLCYVVLCCATFVLRYLCVVLALCCATFVLCYFCAVLLLCRCCSLPFAHFCVVLCRVVLSFTGIVMCCVVLSCLVLSCLAYRTGILLLR